MKRREWLTCGAVLLAAGLMVGCGNIRKLAVSDPKADIFLPKHSTPPVTEPVTDTASAPKIISFQKADGSQLFFAPIVVDSLSGEKMMSVNIDEVVIKGGNRRNLAERNGKINVDFIVSVPSDLQARNWQLVLDPRLKKGQETGSESLDPLVYRGDKYEKMQQHEYADYEQERIRMFQRLRKYVLKTDERVVRNITYQPDSSDKFEYLTDYFTPRYRYDGVDVLPGGEIYTRVDGEYPVDGGRAREAYLRSLSHTPGRVATDVTIADDEKIRRMAEERMDWTGFKRPVVTDILHETDSSIIAANFNDPRYFVPERGSTYGSHIVETRSDSDPTDSTSQPAVRESRVFERLVRHPYVPNARLDTVVYRPDQMIDYYYSEQVQADENTEKLHLYLTGGVEDRGSRRYDIRRTDTLTYNVSSMTSFLDEKTRYMQRVVLRDAEANARFFFTFPPGKFRLVDTLPENRSQLARVRELTRGLMTDPVYIIDSITLRATASPEGTWQVNDRLAHERAEELRRVLVTEFQVLYDSLKIAANYTLDEQGRVVMEEQEGGLPDLPNLLRTKSLAEDWDQLRRLITADTTITDKERLFEIMSSEANPDICEWRIRTKYPKAYSYMRRVLYPQMRAVDFRFNLHRRGMKQDTIYTTEVDSNYMHAVELLKKRRYEQALTILRPYEDRNTALAYMSVGYDAAAYRILCKLPDAPYTAEIQYMLAILAARLGQEEQAVNYFLRAVELRKVLRFRGNLDPEISRLIRKYGLDKNDYQ